MRVIAGEYRRRTLVAPAGLRTRPTTDRLRETLFNILAPRLPGARFVDLYAGSGANGIEALSRGAAQSIFVEEAAPAVAAIRANLRSLALVSAPLVSPPPAAPIYILEARPVASWLRRALSAGQPEAASRQRTVDLIFLDPPYDQAEEYAATLGSLGREASELLAPGALVVAEHRRPRSARAAGAPVDDYGGLHRVRLLEQGDAALSFYAREE